MNKVSKKGAYSTLIKLVVKNTDQKEGIRSWKPLDPFALRGGKRRAASRFEKQRIQSYLAVCVHSKQIDRAFNLVLKQDKDADICQYNTVLKGWARQGQLSQIHRAIQIMSKKDIQPNDATFAIKLLSYAKTNQFNHESLSRLIDEMSKRQINLNKIFQSTYFNEEERNSVRKLIKKFYPDYNDQFLNVPIEYDCNLLKGLNDQTIEPNVIGGVSETEELRSLASMQKKIELKSTIVVKSVANLKITQSSLRKYIKAWDSLVDYWRKALSLALEEDLESLKTQSTVDNRIHIYPYLCSIDKDNLLELMLDEIETNSTFSSFSMSTRQLHLNLGIKVMMRHFKDRDRADGSQIEKQKIYDEFLTKYYPDPDIAGKFNPRQYMQKRAIDMKNYGIYKYRIDYAEEWPHQILVSVGRFLYGIILREAKFDPIAAKNPGRPIVEKNLVNAFYTAYFQVDRSYKIKEEFRTHREFEKLQQKCCGYRLKFDHTQIPCSSPPLPWLSPSFGGYLTTKSELVRTSAPSAEHTASAVKRVKEQKLYPSLDSLNALSICPWIVNKDILDIVLDVFRSGGNPDLTIPYDEIKMKKIAPPVLKKDPSQADKIMYNRDRKKYDQRRREMYSLWCDCLYRLSIANHFRDKVFWFPHNMDFRGRTYPIPPHFNHLGSDLARSLLMFAKGRALGDRGLDWLKIHAINLGGSMKKSSIKERLDHANSILHSDILDSADNPWDGRRWWMKNENPWQVLACCKEISKAIRSKNVKQYVSHLPVHQDGSCNGLQHYAALGRDWEGATAVNLVPSDRPQDVYSRVVDIVEQTRQKDADNGDKIACMLEGLVQRKVIKQTVMTTVYGVTRYGARHQIARQLSARGYPEDQIWKASSYLTTKTFESIGQMFNKSMLIQEWLNRCAYVIASHCGQPVDWETPLGFPIVQPYTKNDAPSAIKMGADVLMDEQPQTRLNPSKQKTAFPPNYIHSLDSCHMMLTSIFCQRAGLTFVSVHDCFWTHPSTVNQMGEICREQFIALHSEPLLDNLGNHFLRRFGQLPSWRVNNNNNNKQKNDQQKVKTLFGDLNEASQRADDDVRNIFSQVPESGDLDLNVIRESTYFFS